MRAMYVMQKFAYLGASRGGGYTVVYYCYVALPYWFFY